MMSLPRKRRAASSRSLEVTRTYLQRGQTVSRSLWVRVSPKHPLLKAAMAPPAAALMFTMLILVLIALGFVLFAVTLMSLRRTGERDANEV